MNLNYSDRAYCLHSVTIFDTSPTDENIRIIAKGENNCKDTVFKQE